MYENRESMTALMSAFIRAFHSTHSDQKIIDDNMAISLFTGEERKLIEDNLCDSIKMFDPEGASRYPDRLSMINSVLKFMNAATVLSRARYAEEELMAAFEKGVRQYMILGAGYDTFALRRPAYQKDLLVFEVDHPATQSSKINRLRNAGIAIPEHLHFIPVDFTKDDLAGILTDSAFSSKEPTFFSWLGVTYYLTMEEISKTLRILASSAPKGSVLVFDYKSPDAQNNGETLEGKVQEIAKQAGEPMKTFIDNQLLDIILTGAGFDLIENLSPDDIECRFFKDRTDGLHAYEHIHFAAAKIK